MKLRSQRALWLVALAAIFCLASRPSLADSQARIVRLSQIEGKVQIDRNTGQGFEKAIVNMPITQGMLLETGADGRAEAEFEDGNVLRLAPGSVVNFQQLSLNSEGKKISRVEVRNGTVFCDIRHTGHGQFTVVLADRDLPVLKPAHFRVEVSGHNVTLAVFSGELHLENKGKQLKVKKGEQLTLERGGDVYLAQSITPESYDAWDKERGSYHERYYNDSSYGSYPYYGRGDLNYYGSWYWLPGYGELWRPNNVGFGFDPFYNGYWSWYPGSGYTWISSYPWGWLPYRYGSWSYVPGWGWGWVPGGYWTSWATAPVIINPPLGYVVPVRPLVPGVPAVIPVPRPGPPKVPVVTPPKVVPVPRGGPLRPRRVSPPAVVVAPPVRMERPYEHRTSPGVMQPQRMIRPNSDMQRPWTTPGHSVAPGAMGWRSEGMGQRGGMGQAPAASMGRDARAPAARHAPSGRSR